MARRIVNWVDEIERWIDFAKVPGLSSRSVWTAAKQAAMLAETMLGIPNAQQTLGNGTFPIVDELERAVDKWVEDYHSGFSDELYAA